MGEAQNNKGVVVWGVIAAGVVIVYTQKSVPKTSESETAVSPKTRSIETNGSADDAGQVVQVLRRLWVPALAASGAQGDFDNCRDDAKGYVATLNCWRIQAQAAVKNEGTADLSVRAATPCAKEVEREAIAHVHSVRSHLEASVRWLSTRSPAFKSKLGARSIYDACEAGLDCVGEPQWEGGEYEGSHRSVYSIKCASIIFRCGTGKDECNLHQAARRLGLNPPDTVAIFPNQTTDAPDDRLYVRATGSRIFP